MSIIDRFLAVLTPYTCLVCGAEGGLMCEGCLWLLGPVPSRCYRCRRASPGVACPTCLPVSGLQAIYAATAYSGSAKDLLWQLKSAGAQTAATLMATLMAARMRCPDGAIIVPVPTASSRVRRRGYDQAKLMAKALSRQTGLAISHCLVRHGQTHQVGASRGHRLQQLRSSFRVNAAHTIVRSGHVLLVDDVLTTGATLETAAQCLKGHGARQISAVVFAQA